MKAWIAFLLVFLISSQVFSEQPPLDEKLLESLIKRGVICKNLTYSQQQEALRIYLSQMAQQQKTSSKKSEPISDKACIAPPEK